MKQIEIVALELPKDQFLATRSWPPSETTPTTAPSNDGVIIDEANADVTEAMLGQISTRPYFMGEAGETNDFKALEMLFGADEDASQAQDGQCQPTFEAQGEHGAMEASHVSDQQSAGSRLTVGVMARVRFQHHQQLMPVSISHMGEYAIATCIAPLTNTSSEAWKSLRRQMHGGNVTEAESL
jgi:hypothetical protein